MCGEIGLSTSPSILAIGIPISYKMQVIDSKARSFIFTEADGSEKGKQRDISCKLLQSARQLFSRYGRSAATVLLLRNFSSAREDSVLMAPGLPPLIRLVLYS